MPTSRHLSVHPSHRRRGVAIFFVIVCLVVLLGFTALTLDVGYIYNVRAEMQNAADSMSLAATSAISLGPDEVRARAREFAQKHSGLAKLSLQDEDIILGRWDAEAKTFTPLSGSDEEDANAVRVIAGMTEKRGNPLQLFFAPALGKHTTNVSASATASAGGGKPWNIVIVQDVTSSFKNEIDEAREADQGLLDCIRESAGDTAYVGLVTFTGYGQVLAPMKILETQYSTLKTLISQIQQCGKGKMPKCSGTNIGVGLDAAIGLLKDLDSDLPKAIILVSDGEPNSSLPGYTTADLKQWAIDSAEMADSYGISIFTLFFSGNDEAVGATEFLASLTKGNGTAHDTPDPSEIATKLQEICKEAISKQLMLVE